MTASLAIIALILPLVVAIAVIAGFVDSLSKDEYTEHDHDEEKLYASAKRFMEKHKIKIKCNREACCDQCPCCQPQPQETPETSAPKDNMLRLILCATLIGAVGCSAQPIAPTLPELAYLEDWPQPVPMLDMPEEMRIENWIGTDEDGASGGSCVHASTLNAFRTAGRFDLEQHWYENRNNGYEGPETAYRIMDKLDDARIPFAATEDGDIRLLEESSRTRRQAVIFYYPGHSINFQGFHYVETDNYTGEAAILFDNNFPDRYIVVDRPTFESSWQDYYGGFGVTPWLEPMPARTYPRTVPRRFLDYANN